jgi:hypothetical protein
LMEVLVQNGVDVHIIVWYHFLTVDSVSPAMNRDRLAPEVSL